MPKQVKQNETDKKIENKKIPLNGTKISNNHASPTTKRTIRGVRNSDGKIETMQSLRIRSKSNYSIQSLDKS